MKKKPAVKKDELKVVKVDPPSSTKILNPPGNPSVIMKALARR